ncbi:MAG: CHAD domain-containing protein, partial [Arenimonas sp.]
LGCAGPQLHEGIHQARKSLRRTRSILALGMAALSPRAFLLDRDIGRLCRGLSAIRDAQALLETLRQPDAAVAELREVVSAAIADAQRQRIAHSLQFKGER